MTPSTPSRTAESVAFMRATERAVPERTRVLDDPWAIHFLGAVTRAGLAGGPFSGRVLPMLTTFIVVRHRRIDDALAAALPTVEQVVLLGAGYDSRAWRFKDALAGRPIFEVDHPATQRRKRRIADTLSPCDARYVSIDFQTERLEDVLVAAGFVPGKPTFFVWEGVSMYLRRAAVKSTLAALHQLGGPGSQVAFDAWHLLDDPSLMATAHRTGANLLSLIGEPVTFSLHPEDAVDFCGRLGWRITDVADAGELERRYIRDGRRVYPASYVAVAERI